MDSNKEQFSLIYDQYIDKIYRFIYVKVNSQEAAQDLTSKVFLKGWESYRSGQEVKSPSAFLYRVAQNMVVDYYRQKDKSKTVSMEAAPQVIDGAPNPHHKAVLSADVELVRMAISNLKQDYQDVIIWHYLEDMPTEQIALLVNKPVGTVRVMIHRGLKALKDELVQES